MQPNDNNNNNNNNVSAVAKELRDAQRQGEHVANSGECTL